jgi:hypothetical protein
MRRLGGEGFGAISILISLVIVALLVVFYLQESTALGPKGGAPGGALEATKIRAQQFEDQQKQRLEQMKDAAQ